MMRNFLIILIIALTHTFAAAHEIYGVGADVMDFYAGNEYLSRWLVPQAREAVDRILHRSPESRPARLADAHVAFFEGRYADSLEKLDKLGVKGEFRDLVKATRDAVGRMKSKRSDNFEVFWGDPRDGILVDGALAGLEAARKALKEKMGYVPPGVVRVEIYPSASEFTAASTLTRKEVETTGIVGLCKFDRLLITSPRATLWGYRWRDTLSHEYAHLVIYRLSSGEAPIWVHEGMAKYLETAWRGGQGGLDPSSLALLSGRAAKKTLISLEKMSPSIAKLPSAEDASLAFAQVATMFGHLARKKGGAAFIGILEAIGAGKEPKEAFGEAWGAKFDDFEREWKNWAEALPKSDRAVEIVGVELGEGAGDEESSSDSVKDPVARDFVRLGDMLRQRGRAIAAAEEYSKAYALSPASPLVVSRHALGRIAAADYAKAAEAVDGVLDLYADMAVLWSRKGEALFMLGRFGDAAAAYAELMEINPFHLPGRVALREIAEKTGDVAEAKRQEGIIGLLTHGGGTPGGEGARERRRER